MKKPASLFGLPFRPEDAAIGEIQHISWRFPESHDFASPKVSRLYEWWRGAGGGRMPLRAAFDVTEHVGIIANLFLVQVLPGGRFRFQLQGEAVTDLLGASDTGRTVSVDDARPYDRELARYYGLVAGDGQARVCTGTLAPFDQPEISIESIDCPLSEDGVTASVILGVIDRVRRA